MEATNWAPEHAAALREYLALGMSYARIAEAINAKFNTDYSRSAAIGRARRMGLADNARSVYPERPPEKARSLSCTAFARTTISWPSGSRRGP